MNSIEQKYLNSREVAEMVEKEHKNLLRDIRNYIDLLTETNFEPSEYFIEDCYKDATGRTLICYLVSKKGCEFIAHKLTGQKGAMFTAKYIERFHEMQDTLTGSMTSLQVLQQIVNRMVEQEQETQRLSDRVDMIEAKATTIPNEYFTIAGFATIRKQKIDVSKANILGRKAANMSRRLGYDIGKISDPRFGTVNTYHVDILNDVFR